jgi:hypothetical protein
MIPLMRFYAVLLMSACLLSCASEDCSCDGKSDAQCGAEETPVGMDILSDMSDTPDSMAPLDSDSMAPLDSDSMAPLDGDVEVAKGKDSWGPEPCKPECEGKWCGGDGCGGYCGWCGAGYGCHEGACDEIAEQCHDSAPGWEDGCEGGTFVPVLLSGPKYHERLSSIDVAARGDSGFVAAADFGTPPCDWLHGDDDGDGCDIEGGSSVIRAFTFGEEEVKAIHLADGVDWSDTGGMPRGVTVAGSPAGDFSVAWAMESSDELYAINAAFFDTDGSPVPTVEGDCSLFFDNPGHPKLAPAGDDSFRLFWRDETPDESGIISAHCSVDGTLLASPEGIIAGTEEGHDGEATDMPMRCVRRWNGHCWLRLQQRRSRGRRL